MAWESNDVRRSIRRYLGLTLGDPWTLRIERRQVRDEERPVALVELGPESTLRAREALVQGEVEVGYPVTISAYPALPDRAEDADPPPDPLREAEAAAEALKTRLSRWVSIGMTVKEGGQHWAGPFRLPLWDYAGVPLTGEKREGPKVPHDVLFVPRESLSVEAIQDAEDLRRWSVVADLRVTMEMPGREDQEGYVAERLEGSYVPPGP